MLSEDAIAHLLCTGALSVVVDKVKEAVGAVEEIVDENILDYCSLDKLVSLILMLPCSCITMERCHTPHRPDVRRCPLVVLHQGRQRTPALDLYLLVACLPGWAPKGSEDTG